MSVLVRRSATSHNGLPVARYVIPGSAAMVHGVGHVGLAVRRVALGGTGALLSRQGALVDTGTGRASP